MLPGRQRTDSVRRLTHALSAKMTQSALPDTRAGFVVAEWSGPEIWRAYMQLTDAEAAFRNQKTDLKLRPVWHQREDRVEAHILVCFLAYVLRKTLEGWSERAGLGHSPGKLLEEFARIQSTDVVLPTKDGRVVRLRCVVQPDKAQKILLDHLGLTLPQRLRMPKGMSPM